MIMHVQADTMMQNTGPGKVHTQFLFFKFFFWVFDFLGYIQQTNSNATAYIPEFCIQLNAKNTLTQMWRITEQQQFQNYHRLLTVPITNYQMAPSERGAGGGSATHKEPT